MTEVVGFGIMTIALGVLHVSAPNKILGSIYLVLTLCSAVVMAAAYHAL